jgi:hypothetical protein
MFRELVFAKTTIFIRIDVVFSIGCATFAVVITEVPNPENILKTREYLTSRGVIK